MAIHWLVDHQWLCVVAFNFSWVYCIWRSVKIIKKNNKKKEEKKTDENKKEKKAKCKR